MTRRAARTRYSGWDVINIPENPQTFESNFEIVISDWVVHADGPTQTAWEYNTKTGEIRPYDYEKAMDAMFGRG